jgi:hypothetical protein
MADFGCVTVEAYKLCAKNIDPRKAWIEACKKLELTEFMQKKGCPMSTFLGLCEEGLVKGIPKGSYTKSKANKNYGLKAVDCLIANPDLAKSPRILWEAIGKSCKYNQQMHVVIALWKEDLIRTEGV